MKYALVFGASGEIGSTCCQVLAQDGWSLYCQYYQHPEKAKSLVRFLQKEYPKQDFYTCMLDLTCEKNFADFFAQLFQVDAIIFASGYTVYKLLPEITSLEMEKLWFVHLKGPLLFCQQLQDKLVKSNHGRIIFIGSVYGIVGSSMETVYSALKGAQQAFANAYSKEVASLGITVNVVAPGAIDTPMNQGWDFTELKQLKREIPMGRMGRPEEIAAVVKFLLSKEAQYVTGTTIPVTGGWLI